MRTTVTIGGKCVGPGHPTFVIAEVGSNHDGDLEQARRMVEVAAEAGVDAVKFQLFRSEWLYPPQCGTVETPMGMVDFLDVLDRCALPPDWIAELAALAQSHGLAFLCTAFDEQALSLLAQLDVPAVKIASPELNHLPLLRASARLHKPLLCSTGLSTWGDIDEALQLIRSEWPDPEVVLLQCVSAYPLPEDEANLRTVATLHEAFGTPVGLSDHTTDCEMVPAIAVAGGAVLIEKHFTLSRDLPGVDHPFSLEPHGLRRMVKTIRASSNAWRPASAGAGSTPAGTGSGSPRCWGTGARKSWTPSARSILTTSEAFTPSAPSRRASGSARRTCGCSGRSGT